MTMNSADFVSLFMLALFVASGIAAWKGAA